VKNRAVKSHSRNERRERKRRVLTQGTPSVTADIGDAIVIKDLAATALELFVSCYGTFAGDIALAFLARGGLYVCGGIAAKLARRLAEPDFLAAFNDKGRHRELVAAIPVRVVTNEKLGLLGAARAAAA
jgi:glucokinase